MLNNFKYFITRSYTLFVVSIFIFTFSILKVSAVYYPTDNITNPTCAPGAVGCYVSLLPDQVGNAGKLLITNGTNPSWSNTIGNDLTINTLTVGLGGGSVSTNTAVGVETLFSNTTGGANTANGFRSLRENTTGDMNSALGYNSLRYNTTGSENVAFGYNSMFANTSGGKNSAFGKETLSSNTTGTYNTAIGYQSLLSNTSGAYNVAIGNNALDANTTGISNIGFGHNALGVNTSGSYNIASGWNTLSANTTGSHNIAFGSDTLGLNTTGIQNIALGQQALVNNLSGQYNVSIGTQSLFNNTTGGNNLAYGYYAGYNSQTGSNNIFIGAQTGLGITTGSNNTIIGANVTGLSSSLSNNIIIADGAGNQRINIDSNGNAEIGGNIYSAGLKWSTTAPVADRQWVDVGYGNGLFVAVAQGSGTDRIMTSPDGVNWTLRTHSTSSLKSITYGNGIFVAAGHSGTRFLTSTDGITWTARTGTGQSFYVTYGNGLFVASKIDNAGLRIITSPDGITWTDRVTPVGADKPWVGITYGNGLFVTVAETNGTQSIMTSPDGINWTLQTHPSVSSGGFENVAYGDGKFVAVGIGGLVMTSPDGVNWTQQSFPNAALLYRITYAEGMFVTAGAFSTTNNNIYTSPDGITWTTRVVPKNDWAGVAYGNGRFVMVAFSGTLGSRVAYSGKMSTLDTLTANIFHGNHFFTANIGIGTTSPFGKLDVAGSSSSTDLVAFDTNRSISVINTNTTTNNAQGIALRSYGTDGTTIQSGVKLLAVNTARTATTITSDLAILTNNAGTISEKMRILANGKVNIGTGNVYNTDSNTLLNVYGNMGVVRANNPASVFVGRTQSGGLPTASATLGSLGAALFDGTNWVAGGNRFAFFAAENWTNSAQGTWMRYASVPVGSNASVNILEITPSGQFNFGTSTLYPALTETSRLMVNGLGSTSSTFTAQFHNSTGTSNSLVVRDDGRVGIGNNAPSHTLHVGSGSVVGIVSRFQNSTGTCDINPTTTSLSCSSDINLKKNITTLKDNQPFVLNSQTPDTNVLKNLNKLTPVIYNWTTEQDTATKQTGFIAQDVEQIFPSLVSTDPTTNLKSLNYIGLIPYAIEGIKELDIKVNQLSSLDDTVEGTFASLIKSYLSNATNRITRIFTGEVCLTDSDGSSECLNKQELHQLKQLLNNQGVSNNTSNPVVEEEVVIPDEPAITPENPVIEEVIE